MPRPTDQNLYLVTWTAPSQDDELRDAMCYVMASSPASALEEACNELGAPEKYPCTVRLVDGDFLVAGSSE